MTNQKFLVSSQAGNNFVPYDEEKSVRENWDGNPITANAPGSSIPGWLANAQRDPGWSSLFASEELITAS